MSNYGPQAGDQLQHGEHGYLYTLTEVVWMPEHQRFLLVSAAQSPASTLMPVLVDLDPAWSKVPRVDQLVQGRKVIYRIWTIEWAGNGVYQVKNIALRYGPPVLASTRRTNRWL